MTKLCMKPALEIKPIVLEGWLKWVLGGMGTLDLAGASVTDPARLLGTDV